MLRKQRLPAHDRMRTLIGNTHILEMCTSPIANGADVGYGERSDWQWGSCIRGRYFGWLEMTAYV